SVSASSNNTNMDNPYSFLYQMDETSAPPVDHSDGSVPGHSGVSDEGQAVNNAFTFYPDITMPSDVPFSPQDPASHASHTPSRVEPAASDGPSGVTVPPGDTVPPSIHRSSKKYIQRVIVEYGPPEVERESRKDAIMEEKSSISSEDEMPVLRRETRSCSRSRQFEDSSDKKKKKLVRSRSLPSGDNGILRRKMNEKAMEGDSNTTLLTAEGESFSQNSTGVNVLYDQNGIMLSENKDQWEEEVRRMSDRIRSRRQSDELAENCSTDSTDEEMPFLPEELPKTSPSSLNLLSQSNENLVRRKSTRLNTQSIMEEEVEIGVTPSRRKVVGVRGQIARSPQSLGRNRLLAKMESASPDEDGDGSEQITHSTRSQQTPSRSQLAVKQELVSPGEGEETQSANYPQQNLYEVHVAVKTEVEPLDEGNDSDQPQIQSARSLRSLKGRRVNVNKAAKFVNEGEDLSQKQTQSARAQPTRKGSRSVVKKEVWSPDEDEDVTPTGQRKKVGNRSSGVKKEEKEKTPLEGITPTRTPSARIAQRKKEEVESIVEDMEIDVPIRSLRRNIAPANRRESESSIVSEKTPSTLRWKSEGEKNDSAPRSSTRIMRKKEIKMETLEDDNESKCSEKSTRRTNKRETKEGSMEKGKEKIVLKLKKSSAKEYEIQAETENELTDVEDLECDLVDPNANYSEKYYKVLKTQLMQNMDEEAADQIVTVERTMHAKQLTLEERLKHVVLGGRYKMETWCDGSYPEEVSRHDTLWICDGCFKYFKSVDTWARHANRCPYIYAPPGDEVYRDKENAISVFRVNGGSSAINTVYCQMLCQFSILFINDKCVYLDVGNFDFFILTDNSSGDRYRPCGYFSRQRISTMIHNISCFCVFPCYQNKGYGRFIIDFSYQLSRISGMPGGPEKPISSYGLASYMSYWKRTIVIALYEFHVNRGQQVSVEELEMILGIKKDDIMEVIQALFSTKKNKSEELTIDGGLMIALAKREIERDKTKIYPWRVNYSQDFVEWMRNFKQHMLKEELRLSIGLEATVEEEERSREDKVWMERREKEAKERKKKWEEKEKEKKKEEE
ncbi:hypothetical protein PFISCL1PPCAC_24269, partial [Pristionchus fissidentatus]